MGTELKTKPEKLPHRGTATLVNKSTPHNPRSPKNEDMLHTGNMPAQTKHQTSVQYPHRRHHRSVNRTSIILKLHNHTRYAQSVCASRAIVTARLPPSATQQRYHASSSSSAEVASAAATCCCSCCADRPSARCVSAPAAAAATAASEPPPACSRRCIKLK